MKIIRLDLKAFGPFSGRSLEFNSHDPGLHIIFGPNEAGKSSSLRALKALLYGFPERTSDNFLHANDQLLVGGCIQDSQGRTLSFTRRKKRKADLLDPSGDPLDPAVLAAFLHNIKPALFESLYGIDHETLVRGGQDILAQKGEAGQALFAAGAGISSLRQILDTLDADAAALFKAQGRKQSINQAIGRYEELKKEVRDASLSSREWKEHQRRLQEAEGERERLGAERNRKNAEMRRLERLVRAIPELALLENLREQMVKLDGVIVLPPDFAEHCSHVERQVRETALRLEKDLASLKKLRQRPYSLPLNEALLHQAAKIEELHQRLGEYRKGMKDRIRLDGERISNRKEAASLLKQVRPDLSLNEVELLRPVLLRKRTIQALCSQHEAIVQQARLAQKQIKEREQELLETGRALEELPQARDVHELLEAVRPARAVGDIDGDIADKDRMMEDDRAACEAELKRIGFWSGGLGQLLDLALPLPDTVKRFEVDYSGLDDDRRQLKKDRKGVEQDLLAARTEIKKVEYGGDVPAEQDLAEVRLKRDHGWRLLRRKWLAGEDVSRESHIYDNDLELPEAYEKQVERADHIADRLRREADRVANAAALRARVESLEEMLQKIVLREEEVIRREQGLASEWQVLWGHLSIEPLSPSEMTGWLNEMDKLRHRVREIWRIGKETEKKKEIRERMRMTLVKELKAFREDEAFSGPLLTPVLVLAELILEQTGTVRAGRDNLLEKEKQTRKNLGKAIEDFQTAQASLAGWKENWRKAAAGLGIEDHALPSVALDLVEALQGCFDKVREADGFQKRIAGINRDAEEYAGELKTLVEQVAPDLTNAQLEQSVVLLHDMLVRAGKDNALHKKITEEIQSLELEVDEAAKTMQALEKQMADLLRTAGCENQDGLAGAIRKSAEFLRLKEKISDAEAALAKTAQGVPLDEIIRQAAQVNMEELPGQINGISKQIEEELNPQINHWSEIVGELTRELQRMDGGARAAQAAEGMEHELSRIRRLADQYVRIRLAAALLRQEIERYREEHQDPVLKIASRYFSELTLGSFSGVRADVSDSGEPVLVGVKPGEKRLTVEQMSSGTRDQLYLSLRLATLEWRLQSGEPMPFIVDDILVNFDDERSRATLKALAGLSRKNQVLLFTHHGRIASEAGNLKSQGSIHIHEI